MEIVKVEKEERIDPLGIVSSPQALKGAKTAPRASRLDILSRRSWRVISKRKGNQAVVKSPMPLS